MAKLVGMLLIKKYFYLLVIMISFQDLPDELDYL